MRARGVLTVFVAAAAGSLLPAACLLDWTFHGASPAADALVDAPTLEAATATACPVDEPTSGSACAADAGVCEYTLDPRPACRPRWRCGAGQWQRSDVADAGLAPGCATLPDCADSGTADARALASLLGCDASPPPPICDYSGPRLECACVAASAAGTGSGAKLGGCFPSPSNTEGRCPAPPRPRVGTSCCDGVGPEAPADGVCNYGIADAGTAKAIRCVDCVWRDVD